MSNLRIATSDGVEVGSAAADVQQSAVMTDEQNFLLGELQGELLEALALLARAGVKAFELGVDCSAIDESEKLLIWHAGAVASFWSRCRLQAVSDRWAERARGSGAR